MSALLTARQDLPQPIQDVHTQINMLLTKVAEIGRMGGWAGGWAVVVACNQWTSSWRWAGNGGQQQHHPRTLALGGCSMGLMVVDTSRASSSRSSGGGVMLLEAWSTALCAGLTPSAATT